MSWTQTRAKIANAKRTDPNADVSELQRQLKAERLEEHIRGLVDAAPPLSATQRAHLASILVPVDATRGQRAAS